MQRYEYFVIYASSLKKNKRGLLPTLAYLWMFVMDYFTTEPKTLYITPSFMIKS